MVAWRGEGEGYGEASGGDGHVHCLDGDVVTVSMLVMCSDASHLYVDTKSRVTQFKYVKYYISVVAQ